jgi:hypothetical protein
MVDTGRRVRLLRKALVARILSPFELPARIERMERSDVPPSEHPPVTAVKTPEEPFACA